VIASAPRPFDEEQLRERLIGAGRIEVVGEVDSTSSALIHAVRADSTWPDRSVMVADHQTSGRGRLGRTWATPAGSALTVSVLLRLTVPPERWAWLPLLAGVAVARALGDFGVQAGLKWPNDVLVPVSTELPGWGAYRKVAGVLAEAVDLSSGAVVLGIGVNVSQEEADLPVPSATSLALSGVHVTRSDVLERVFDHLVALDDVWRAASGDAHECGLAAAWARLSVTPRRVAVDLPGGELLQGETMGLDRDGALLVDPGTGPRAVRAGDVRLRARQHDVSASGGTATD
jgi:BirA family transcriptional regulator, biotin operon repressor / biotin---[acetyl-CoA-carboxylase] ligase